MGHIVFVLLLVYALVLECNLPVQVHFMFLREHCRGHGRMVLSWGWFSMLSAFVSA